MSLSDPPIAFICSPALQELASMGAVLPTPQGMRDWCYSAASDYSSLTFDG